MERQKTGGRSGAQAASPGQSGGICRSAVATGRWRQKAMAAAEDDGGRHQLDIEAAAAMAGGNNGSRQAGGTSGSCRQAVSPGISGSAAAVLRMESGSKPRRVLRISE